MRLSCSQKQKRDEIKRAVQILKVPHLWKTEQNAESRYQQLSDMVLKARVPPMVSIVVRGRVVPSAFWINAARPFVKRKSFAYLYLFRATAAIVIREDWASASSSHSDSSNLERATARASTKIWDLFTGDPGNKDL